MAAYPLVTVLEAPERSHASPQVPALVDSHRGDHDAAEQFARAAVEFLETTQAPKFQADAHCDLAEVLEAAGRPDQAIAAWDEALERYERKGVIPLARRVRERLASLQPV